MSLIAKPVTFVDSVVLTAALLNPNFDAIFNEFNGNITDANIKAGANINASKLLAASITGVQLGTAAIIDSKLDYTSVKVLRIGPTFPGSNGKRIAIGRKSITFAAGVASGTITFSTDAEDGNPNFSAAPRVLVGVERSTGTNSYYAFVGTTPTTTSFTFGAVSSAGADATTQDLVWYAIGNA